jgi:hypothetical protein
MAVLIGVDDEVWLEFFLELRQKASRITLDRWGRVVMRPLTLA